MSQVSVSADAVVNELLESMKEMQLQIAVLKVRESSLLAQIKEYQDATAGELEEL